MVLLTTMGTYNGIEGNGCEVSSSYDKWDVNDTKYWVGGGISPNPSDDEYEHLAELAEGAVGFIPIFGDAYAVTMMIYHLALYFENDPTSAILNRHWTWGDAFSGEPQSQIFNRWDAECDPGERGGFTAKDYTTAERYDGSGGFFQRRSEFLVNFAAPETSPSSLSMQSARSLQSKGIRAVPTKKVRRNPHEFGFTPEEAADLPRNEIVYFAPVDVNVIVK